jgi:probable rRNA maturation factor
MSTLLIRNTTRTNPPHIPFKKLKDAVLGDDYELSLVFCGKTLSQRLNKEHRGKDRPTDILSFELDKTSGEIFIYLDLLKKEAKDYDRSFKDFVAFLFIHGLHHLKGLDHGSTMERREKQVRERFGF